jgi:hypothetical protein
MLPEGIELLARLEGRWVGEGRGGYPTIPAFHFEEETTFTIARAYPHVRYEQKARLLPDGKASHWELGFFRPLEHGLVEVSNAQDSGRVEVLRGSLVALEEPAGLRLELASVCIANDPRVVKTERILTLRGDTLHYVKYMVTTTTEIPEREQHLEASLKRVPAAR